MRQELTYVTAAADLLKQHGKAFIGYITAGIEPYSAQQKPDISFVPRTGTNAGRVFFVELRLFESGKVPQHYLKALREHRDFAIEGAECDYAGFAFATNASLAPSAIQQLAENDIHYLGPVDSAEVLAERIKAWASVPV